MRPVERFLSQLDRYERRQGGDPEESLIRDFTGLIAPVLGREAAGDLCAALLKRREGGRSPCLALGYAAAFLLGEFDESMELEAGEWEDIRSALEDAAGEMDLATLSSLMGELLSRGKLR